MELHWLKPLLGRPAPFITVCLDATRAESAGEAAAVDRWRALRRDLDHAGAPVELLDEIEDAVARPTHLREPHGRVIVADAQGVRVDRVLVEAPVRSWAVRGPAPALLPVVRAACQSTRSLLVVVDRRGADFTFADETGPHPTRQLEVVEGGHDVVHKGNEGGLSDRRTHARAEDSWERNAQAVATEVDRVVAEKKPEILLVTGDVRAVALLHESVGQRARSVWVDVPGGSRSDGVNQTAFDAQLGSALATHRAERTRAVLAQFREEQGRGAGAVTELSDVIAVLRRGQARELVLHESIAGASSPIAGRTAWVGPDPLQLALTRSELEAIGVTEGAREIPADIALVRAAVGQDAGLTFATNGAVDLVDGVGVLLRWSDGSTPSESVPSLSSDRKRMHSIV